MTRLERDVAVEIRAYLLRLGLHVFRSHVGTRTAHTRPGSAGLPDFYGILPDGRWWAIEVKAPGARPRKNETAQNEVLSMLFENGAVVVVASSVAEVATIFSSDFIRDCRVSRLASRALA